MERLSITCGYGAEETVIARLERRGAVVNPMITCVIPGKQAQITYYTGVKQDTVSDRLERDDIYAYHIGGYAFCEEHCIQIGFDGDEVAFFLSINSNTFQTLDGAPLDLTHEDTFQYEQYVGHLVPVEGLYCRVCGAELYAPVEDEL
jgi:hypothetical protein